MNQTWPILSKIKSEPYKLNDGNMLCYAVDVTLNDWGSKQDVVLHFCSLSQALALKAGEEIRR